MEVYCVLLETNNGSSDVESDIIVCESLDKAKSVLLDFIRIESEDYNQEDLENGQLYVEDESFCFYEYIGGDWKYRGNIYHRPIEK